jgi:hypothetical protein
MTSLPAKVIAIEKRADQYQVIVQISTKYRGSFNTLPGVFSGLSFAFFGFEGLGIDPEYESKLTQPPEDPAIQRQFSMCRVDPNFGLLTTATSQGRRSGAPTTGPFSRDKLGKNERRSKNRERRGFTWIDAMSCY